MGKGQRALPERGIEEVQELTLSILKLNLVLGAPPCQ